MAWVFRKCRHLTPSTALLVIMGAVLWFPISFAVATAMHAVLFAEAHILAGLDATLASASNDRRQVHSYWCYQCIRQRGHRPKNNPSFK